MKGKKQIVFLLSIMMMASLILPALVFASGAQENGDTTKMSFVSAPTDGEWYVIASGLWDIWRKNVPGLEVTILPGGGHGNVEAVGKAQADMGMASSTDVAGAYLGVIPFEDEQYSDVSVLFTLTTESMYTVAWKDSGIEAFTDIKGKRVNVKPKGYSSHALNKIVFQAVGLDMENDIKPEYLGDAEAIQLMQDNQIDVLMSGGLLPDSSYIELSLRRPIKIISYGQNVIDAVCKLNPGLFNVTIPSGIYNGIEKDIPAVGYTLTVFINKNLPEELVYQMTKSVAENIGELYDSVAAMKGVQGSDLFKDIGVPYHSGAAKYIEEMGY